MIGSYKDIHCILKFHNIWLRQIKVREPEPNRKHAYLSKELDEPTLTDEDKTLNAPLALVAEYNRN